MDFYEKLNESKDFIMKEIKDFPDLAIILGSGLGELVSSIQNKIFIDYKNIPYFPQSTVKGHSGRLIFGKIENKTVLCMDGRFHYFEGYSMRELCYPIYVFKLLNIKNLIITNACGGINQNFQPGDLMLIEDFINLMGDNPLRGKNDDRLGTRFPDMSEPYSIELIEHAESIAKTLNITYQKGVYAGFQGPYYETKAEIEMIKRHGADAVGMSTVPETIVANYLGMSVLGISCITNMATGIQKCKHSHEQVLETAKKASKNLCLWIERLIKNIKLNNN